MKGVLIFAGGVLTGAAATFGVLAVIQKKRAKYDVSEEEIDISRDDSWEEYSPEEEEKEKVNTKEEDNSMNENINVDIANEHNDLVNKYAAEHREVPDIFLEPILFTEEEFRESPYDKVGYTYLQKEDILLDENGAMVVDDRCGEAYADTCIQEGVAYVCNEELEQLFEITLDSESTYEDMSINDEWYDD